MIKLPTEMLKVDAEIHPAIKIAAIQDGKTLRAWVSDVLREELNRRGKRALEIRPLTPTSALRWLNKVAK